MSFVNAYGLQGTVIATYTAGSDAIEAVVLQCVKALCDSEYSNLDEKEMTSIRARTFAKLRRYTFNAFI